MGINIKCRAANDPSVFTITEKAKLTNPLVPYEFAFSGLLTVS